MMNPNFDHPNAPTARPPATTRRDALKLLAVSGLAAATVFPRLLRGAEPTAGSSPAEPAPPAPKGLNESAFYRFRIGDFEATSLTDGTFSAPPTAPVWAPEAGPGEVEAALRANFLPTDRIQVAFNVLLVRTGKETVLVDSGNGSLFGPTAGKLDLALAAAGVSRDEITAVFLTHAHPDHFGGLLDAEGKPRFRNAQHYASQTEWDFWTAPQPDLSKSRADEAMKKQFTAAAQRHLLALDDRFVRLKSGQSPVAGIEALPAPGHTPGHLTLRIRSGGEELLHIADTAHHPVLMFENPDWTVAFDTDSRLAAASRRKLFETAVAGRTRLFGYHLPFPGLGHVRPARAGYEWVPEPWTTLAAG